MIEGGMVMKCWDCDLKGCPNRYRYDFECPLTDPEMDIDYDFIDEYYEDGYDEDDIYEDERL